MMQFGRRRLLAAVLAGGAWSICKSVLAIGWSSDIILRKSAAERLVDAVFAHKRSAVVLGRSYLQTERVDQETVLRRLIGDIFPEQHNPESWVTTAEKAELRRALAARIRDDFDAECVVSVDGWVLSATEARLCALAALA
jgi:hypothetical protein